MRVAKSHAVFAVTLIALGIMGLVAGDFAAVWQPVPKGVPARELLAYLCATVALASGLGLLSERTAATMARLLFAYLMLWLLLFRVPGVFLAPQVEGSWSSWGETAVLAAAAWVLYTGVATDWDQQHFNFATGEAGRRKACVLYGLAMIPFGVAHFIYLKETAALVPGWLPSHLVLAYFTGCAFIAAGAAMILGPYARSAALLSAVQMGLFTLLVWVPIVAAGTKIAYQRSETVLSWALTAAAWVVADSYRGMPWRAVNKR